MVSILASVALLFGIAGLLFLTPATAGVGLIAFACLLGIVARLIQASTAPATGPTVSAIPSTVQDPRTRSTGLYLATGLLLLAALWTTALRYLTPDRLAWLFSR